MFLVALRVTEAAVQSGLRLTGRPHAPVTGSAATS
jgi:hypothetical protein